MQILKTGRVNYDKESYCPKCEKRQPKTIQCINCGWKVRNHPRYMLPHNKREYKRY